MEYQQRSYSCGPAALRSVLYILGHNITESRLRRLANTTPQNGTDEFGMIRALGTYGYRAKELHEHSKRRAWVWLLEQLEKGRPVVLCVDEWNHWVSVIGVLGKKVIVFDPERAKTRSRRYSGLKPYDDTELLNRWVCHEEKPYYYAMAVYKPNI